jgi:saccharopine dehydrogenase-like NADP-dependent oxidoreductase
MARTTGYTCTSVVNLVIGGKFKRKGISPPELVGADEENYEFVVEYLKDRGVNYRVTITDAPSPVAV